MPILAQHTRCFGNPTPRTSLERLPLLTRCMYCSLTANPSTLSAHATYIYPTYSAPSSRTSFLIRPSTHRSYQLRNSADWGALQHSPPTLSTSSTIIAQFSMDPNCPPITYGQLRRLSQPQPLMQHTHSPPLRSLSRLPMLRLAALLSPHSHRQCGEATFSRTQV